MQTSPELATAFTIFPKLPVELRLKIWKFALPGRRIVDIRCDKQSVLFEKYRSSTPIPSILHVCSESRTLASKVYELAFRTTPSSRSIYFNFSADLLVFNCKHFDLFCRVKWFMQDAKNAKRVAHIGLCSKLCLDAGNVESRPRLSPNYRAELAKMTALQRIVCTTHNSRGQEGEDSEHLEACKHLKQRYFGIICEVDTSTLN